MKKAFSALALVALFSFNTTPEHTARAIEKTFGKIKENIYINKYEVSNASYRDFLAALPAEKASAFLPDSLVWRDTHTYNEPFTEYYFRYPSYSEYPVVGVSFEDAQAYCKWLTDTYNNDSKRKYKKVLFRLPSREEWELAANGGDASKQYPWGTGFLTNNRSMALCNYRSDAQLKYDSATKKYEDAAPASGALRTKITSPVKAFFPSSFGMYNMSGNVAEMISEKGTAKGGSYNDPAWEVTIKSERKYTQPASDLGFRVAMEVVER